MDMPIPDRLVEGLNQQHAQKKVKTHTAWLPPQQDGYGPWIEVVDGNRPQALEPGDRIQWLLQGERGSEEFNHWSGGFADWTGWSNFSGVSAYCIELKESPSEMTPTAPQILDAAAGHMRDRAATYDSPRGERSMGRAVAALNAVLGRQALTESEGWLLMQLLKDVRERQRVEPHRDSLEDGVAYAALKAEARLQEGGAA